MLGKIREFLSYNVFPIIGIGGIATRRKIAKQYLFGEGLEIGALHTPIKLPKKITVKYLDLIDYETAIDKFPELNRHKLVKPDYIDNGFELGKIDNQSQDFVIANHVLEHSPNPIQVLRNWLAAIKPGGMLFFSVPVGEMCFDKGRELTSLDHFIKDYTDELAGNDESLEANNMKHYEEWVTFSEPNILRQNGFQVPTLNKGEIAQKAIEVSKNANVEIHYHTFSLKSLTQFVEYFCQEVELAAEVKLVMQNKAELIAVIQRHNSA